MEKKEAKTSKAEKIILDTNFLLSQYEYGLDIRSELLRIARGPIELIVPSGGILELKMLAGRHGRRAVAARFALQHFDSLKDHFAITIVDSTGRVDDWIIKYAQKNMFSVATNDVPLRRQVLSLGVRVIGMRSKSKLDFI